MRWGFVRPIAAGLTFKQHYAIHRPMLAQEPLAHTSCRIMAVNRVWDVRKDRPFYIRKLRDLGMALGTGILFLLSVGATAVFSILRATELPVGGIAADVAARLLAFLFSLGIFLVIYKFMPNAKTYWRYVWPGAVLAAVLFEIAKTLLVFYLDHFASYDMVYGSVASVIILLFWIYISAFILILGGEFSSEYGRMREETKRGAPITTTPLNNADIST